jgi:hypothetical protein
MTAPAINTLSGKAISAIQANMIAGDIVDKFVALPQKRFNGTGRNDDQQGGCLVIMDNQNISQIFGQTLICYPWKKNIEKYREYCLKQARHLFQYPHNTSSFQSRMPTHNQWGGAIRTPQYILSFAGLTELGNEAVALALSVKINIQTVDDAKRIAKISNNIFLHKLLSA